MEEGIGIEKTVEAGDLVADEVDLDVTLVMRVPVKICIAGGRFLEE